MAPRMVRSARMLHIHLRGLIMLRPPHYMRHNLAGSVMIIALFAVLCGLVVTGLFVLGGEEKQGPLAAIVAYATSTTARRIHELLAIVVMAMIATHIAGVLVEGRLLRIPLMGRLIGASGMIDPFKCCWKCFLKRCENFLLAARVVHGEHDLSECAQEFCLEQPRECLRDHDRIVAKHA